MAAVTLGAAEAFLCWLIHRGQFPRSDPGIVMIGEIDSGLESITAATDNGTVTLSTVDD
ncbi:hypothetical protein [Mycobacterium sp. MUNTM1]